MVSFCSGKVALRARFVHPRDGGIDSAKWRDRLDGIIRAESQGHAVVEKLLPRVGGLRALGADALHRPVHVGEQMIGLHGGDDAELAILRELVRGDDLVVLDAEAEVARLIVLAGGSFGGGESVERHLHGAVSDGVKADLESGRRALNRHAIQLVLLVTRQAGVAGIVGIRRQQRRRARSQRAVHEALEHGGVQHGIVGRMVRAVRLQKADGVVKGEPFADAQRQLAFALQVFVDEENVPTGIVLGGSDTPAGGVGQGEFGGAATAGGSWRRDFRLDQVARGLAQNASGLAVGIVIDFAAFRSLRLRR